MLKVGITGGIGSGKSYVANIFKTLGIPVYNADEEARKLMSENTIIKAQLINAFGIEAYNEQGLDRSFIAKIVFDNKEKLDLLNKLIHPEVIKASNEWMSQQKTPYALKEAALIFESNSNKTLDKVIGVTAPLLTRIERAMKRDHATKETIEARIAKQMDDAAKMKLCDFVIINDGVSALLPQVLEIHEALLVSCSG